MKWKTRQYLNDFPDYPEGGKWVVDMDEADEAIKEITLKYKLLFSAHSLEMERADKLNIENEELRENIVREYLKDKGNLEDD